MAVQTIFFPASGMRGDYVSDMVLQLEHAGFGKVVAVDGEIWSKGGPLRDGVYTALHRSSVTRAVNLDDQPDLQ